MVMAGVPGKVRADEIGRDLREVFLRAKRGEPLRYVAMGGSITGAARGGWIGPWLRSQFPSSTVTVSNAGMSATGSALGVFRLERDVIALQPDLVILEFCVNDGNCADEHAVRYMETLVVRLKQLPHPPAIVIVEVAAKGGVNLSRHRLVARHYGLLEIDLQRAVDEHLQSRKLPWSAFFEDEVHPNAEGHEFYAKIIESALEPFVRGEADAVQVEARTPLRPPLSAKPLLLDATMISLGSVDDVAGWSRESAVPFWWNRFFLGFLGAANPGATLRLPVRGTTVGLFYPMHPSYGKFLTSVDGACPQQITQNTRDGYGFDILAGDLLAQEHVLSIVLSSEGPVKLGYLLVAGQGGAGHQKSEQGFFSADVLRDMRFAEIPSDRWTWNGPYIISQPNAIDAHSAMHRAFLPEKRDAAILDWRAVSHQRSNWIDFRAIAEISAPSIVYASAELDSTKEERVILGLAADYFAKLWVNGDLLATFDSAHGHTHAPLFLPVVLKAGKNQVLVKLGSGTMGFGFSLSVGRFSQ